MKTEHEENHRGTETQSRKGVAPEMTRRCPGLTAELPAIWRSPATGEKSAGSASFPFGEEACRPNRRMEMRNGETCARKAQAAGPGHRDERLRSYGLPGPVVLAAVRRPGSRRTMKFCIRLSAPLR
jgi:hypothetical protein